MESKLPTIPASSTQMSMRISEAGPSTSTVPSKTENTTTGPARKRIRKRKHPENIPKDPQDWSTPWLDSLGTTEYESKEQRLHDEIVAFVQWIQPTIEERRARQLVIEATENVLRKRLPRDVRILAFGSTAHDLYLPDGDVDLVVLTPQPYDDRDKKQKLFQFLSVLRSSRMVGEKAFVVHRARVPVISFETLPELGSLKFDVSINGEDGIHAIPIIKQYLDKLPALRPLVLVVKTLLAKHELGSAGNGGLSSYSVICLIISFLQLNPCNIPEEDISNPLRNESLGTLLEAFLDYYGNRFPYETSTISVSSRSLLTKAAKGWENPKQPGLLSIECLLNPENDIGRATGKIAQVRKVFHEAHLAHTLYRFDLAHENVLGAVVGVSSKTIEHREHVKNLVKSGSLERSLQQRQLSGPPRLHASLPQKPTFTSAVNMPPRKIPQSSARYNGDMAYGYATASSMERSTRLPSRDGYDDPTPPARAKRRRA